MYIITFHVISSVPENFSKSIRNISVVKVPLKFSHEVKAAVGGLEVLQNFNSIQDINYSTFLEYSKKPALSFDEEAFQEVISVRKYKNQPYLF